MFSHFKTALRALPISYRDVKVPQRIRGVCHHDSWISNTFVCSTQKDTVRITHLKVIEGEGVFLAFQPLHQRERIGYIKLAFKSSFSSSCPANLKDFQKPH